MSIILSLAAIRSESGQRGRHAQPARISGKDPVRLYGTRMSVSEVEAAITRNDPDELLLAVLSAALYADDGEWAESVCERLARHEHPTVRGNAVLGFGHIARLQRTLRRTYVRFIVEAALKDPDPYVRGQAESAADDLEQFLGWPIGREGQH
jgi:hypothetical protein